MLFFFLSILISLNSVLFSEITFPKFEPGVMESGHSVYITKSSDESTEWKFELLKQAKRSIDMSAGYCGGQVFHTLLDILTEQLQNNPIIKIRLFMTQVTNMISSNDKDRLRTLQEQFPERFTYLIRLSSFLLFQEHGIYTTENHVKLLIIDEKYFLLGGTNLIANLCTEDSSRRPDLHTIPAAFLPQTAADMDIVASGPMAAKLRREFFALCELYLSDSSLKASAGPFIASYADYFEISDEEKTAIPSFDDHPEVVHDVPLYGVLTGPRLQLHTAGAIYKFLIEQARQMISLGHLYFFPVAPIYTALQAAVNRGVELDLITNGINTEIALSNSTRSLYGYINRINYFPMMTGRSFRTWEFLTAQKAPQKRVSIYELDVPYMLYHKKVMVVDHRFITIGSYNLGAKSENADYEVLVVLDAPKTAMQVEMLLNQDKLRCQQIELTQAFSWYFNPFYNLLSDFEKNFFDGVIFNYKEFKNTHTQVKKQEKQ